MSDLTSSAAHGVPTDEREQSEQVLKLHVEEVAVSRRRIEGDTVRVRTAVHTHEELVEEDVHHEHVSVSRVAIGRVVETVPDIRQEGDVMIIPVVEEEIVVQRRLILKEEIHVHRQKVAELYRETVVLRRENAVIERVPSVDSPTRPHVDTELSTDKKPGAF